MQSLPARHPPQRDINAGRRAGIGVAVVDDHPAVCGGLRALLDSEPGITPVGVAGSAHEATALVARSRPEVVMLDYHLPGEDGLSLCLRLKAADELPRALVYSAFADENLTVLAAIAGADALIEKGCRGSALCDAVRRVARGERLLPPLSVSALAAAGAQLEPRDLPVLGMLAHGTVADEIAGALGMTEAQLATRRSAMLARLRATAVTPLHSRDRLPDDLPTPG